MTIEQLRKKIKTIIEEKKKDIFEAKYQDKATDEETLGIIIAHYFDWNGISILKTTYAALEDANFHTENETIEKLIEELEHPRHLK